MFGSKLFQLLLLALVLAFVTDAASPAVKNNGLEARQDDNTDSSSEDNTNLVDLPTTISEVSTEPVETTTTEQEETTAEPSSTQEEEPTSATVTTEEEPTSESTQPPTTSTTEQPVEETSTTEQAEETTTTEPPTSEGDSTTSAPEESAPSTTSEEPASTTSESDNEDNNDDETSTTQEPVTSTSWETITRTNAAGELETTTSAAATTTLGLNGGDGGDSGGLSAGTRNIIIGVVVGVGGAIILGALGIVAWRIRARKRLAEENDGLMEYNGGYTAVDKSDPPVPGSSPSTAPTGSTRSPFQSTLENYHQPTQPVTASSNF